MKSGNLNQNATGLAQKLLTPLSLKPIKISTLETIENRRYHTSPKG